MTEREKMLSGELYDPTDKELEQLRVNARKLARKYNSTEEDDQEEQAQILRKLLPATEELPYLQAPVYFDYGCNTFFGRFSSANFNFTCLDVCEIHIGARQTGKTYIVERFAEENYEEIPSAMDIFSSDLKVDNMVMAMSVFDDGKCKSIR